MRKISAIFYVLTLLCLLDVKAQVAKIPFEYSGGHLYIKVQTGSSDTLRFVFDTGATGASIDSSAAVRAGINKSNLAPASVAGSGGSKQYMMATGQSLKLSGIELRDINLVLVNFAPLSRATGAKLDGIIGYELLNRYTTKIDFDRREIQLYDGIDKVDTTGYVGIPFEFSKGIMIPRFPISITLANGESFTGKVMFDTGNANTLLVSTPFSMFHNFNSKLGEVALSTGRGMNAYTNNQMAVINSMSFNGFDFGKMVVSLTVNENAKPADGYLGILGIEVIKRFNVILDYAHKKIYLKPNQNFKNSFNTELTKGKVDQSLAGTKFLEQNGTKAGIVSTPSGLQYKILKAGKGKRPLASDRVKIYYSLSLINGEKIGDSFDAQVPWIHHLDKALLGMQEAIQLMPVGSKWVLYMPAPLAFGSQGYENVSPGSVVVCEIELAGIE